LKILLLDIETSPNVAHVWGLFKQNVSISQLQSSSYVMMWSAKWLGGNDMHFGSMHKSTAKKMLKPIHALLDEADAVIHYNGKSFDIPTLNKEFLLYGFRPPSPFKEVDLLLTARDRFRFPSNKLDYICKALNLGEKTKHAGHELWVRCLAGETAAWKEMEAYNRNDVVLLESLYNKLLPWIRNHPNRGTFDEGGNQCPNCGGHKLQRRGYARTQVNKFVRLQCTDCGTWCREPVAETTREERAQLMRPIAQ